MPKAVKIKALCFFSEGFFLHEERGCFREIQVSTQVSVQKHEKKEPTSWNWSEHERKKNEYKSKMF